MLDPARLKKITVESVTNSWNFECIDCSFYLGATRYSSSNHVMNESTSTEDMAGNLEGLLTLVCD